jgi:hypothetical protein
VCHILAEDNTGEFDPFTIERIKNCMQMMVDKHFIEVLEKDLIDENTFTVKKEASDKEEVKVLR